MDHYIKIEIFCLFGSNLNILIYGS